MADVEIQKVHAVRMIEKTVSEAPSHHMREVRTDVRGWWKQLLAIILLHGLNLIIGAMTAAENTHAFRVGGGYGFNKKPISSTQ